jgi:hypothetical protein
MKPGDRVTIPGAVGTVKEILTEDRWTFDRSDKIAWILVIPDGRDQPQIFPPRDVELLEPTIPWP